MISFKNHTTEECTTMTSRVSARTDKKGGQYVAEGKAVLVLLKSYEKLSVQAPHFPMLQCVRLGVDLLIVSFAVGIITRRI